VHHAPTVEAGAALDGKFGRGDIANHDTGREKFNGRFCKYIALNFPAYNHRCDGNRTIDLSPLADDECVVAPDLTAENAVDSDAAVEVKLAFEARSRTEKCRNIAAHPRTAAKRFLFARGVPRACSSAWRTVPSFPTITVARAVIPFSGW
jgi:hypothetical protein